ncbi:MAG: Wadjet anti-phage system protein JetD domain-containing protein [Vulcanimicrobiota bacterium]
MSWTTPTDLRKKLERWWESGKLLKAEFSPELFPLKIKLQGPTTRQLGSDFGKVSDWIKHLETGGVPLSYQEVRHRVIGSNQVPTHAVFGTLDAVAEFLKKRRELALFRELLALTRERRPEFLDWIAERPNRVLALAEDWTNLLSMVQWMEKNPRPEVYLRQVDLSGIDTKFLEKHKKTLTRLLRLLRTTLPQGSPTFEAEFGFRERPARVRFRLLDSSPHYPPGLTDLTLTVGEFAHLDPGLRRAFIVENEVNFLAFPALPHSLVIFGSGYEVGALKLLEWLGGYELYYWGDLDTHGFAILNRLRAHFPQAVSLLMDRETLEAHRRSWVMEPQPTSADLERLSEEEQELYQALILNRFGERVRLEQELIGYRWVLRRLERFATPSAPVSNCRSEV